MIIIKSKGWSKYMSNYYHLSDFLMFLVFVIYLIFRIHYLEIKNPSKYFDEDETMIPYDLVSVFSFLHSMIMI